CRISSWWRRRLEGSSKVSVPKNSALREKTRAVMERWITLFPNLPHSAPGSSPGMITQYSVRHKYVLIAPEHHHAKRVHELSGFVPELLPRTPVQRTATWHI
ncbi:MAG TPA: hypothetical protein VGE21_06570, partial [Flavobacteriales bacterium]